MTRTLGTYSAAVMTAVAMVASIFAFALPASADINGDVRVRTYNTATFTNSASASASTGGNEAHGSFGGDAGDADNEEGGGNSATGGNGGNAGAGGLVSSGNASALVGIENQINDAEADVGGNGNINGDVRVRTRNDVVIGNVGTAAAATRRQRSARQLRGRW